MHIQKYSSIILCSCIFFYSAQKLWVDFTLHLFKKKSRSWINYKNNWSLFLRQPGWHFYSKYRGNGNTGNVQWSLVNPDTINPDASLSKWFFLGNIYHMCFSNTKASFFWMIFLGTKVSRLMKFHFMYWFRKRQENIM
jgi:hypothetical protein